MKTISILSMVMAFGFGSQTAQAGFLGMPLQLKAVIQHVEHGTPQTLGNPSRGSDDALTDPGLVISC